MEKDQQKGYKIIETGNYISLFFAGSAENEKRLPGSLRQNLVELLTDPTQKPHKEKVLEELKSEAGKALLLDAINHHRRSEKLPALIAAAWEAGLDMSAYLELFVKIAIEENSLAALEALTVIEEMISLPPAPLPELISVLDKAIPEAKAEKEFILTQIRERLKDPA